MKIWSTAANRLAALRQRPKAMAEFPWEHEWPEIIDTRVRAAFAQVDRAAFVPADLRHCSANDAPLPIGQGQTISQPYVVALMLQALALKAGQTVLEIGTGSGYQTAILCYLTAKEDEVAGSRVYSIERHEQLARRASQALQVLNLHANLKIGDGGEGWPDAAPFAAIVLSAAPPYLPRPLWDQLAEGGRLVAPIGASAEDQMLWLLQKRQGQMIAETLGAVRFVPMITPVLDDPANRITIGFA